MATQNNLIGGMSERFVRKDYLTKGFIQKLELEKATLTITHAWVAIFHPQTISWYAEDCTVSSFNITGLNPPFRIPGERVIFHDEHGHPWVLYYKGIYIGDRDPERGIVGLPPRRKRLISFFNSQLVHATRVDKFLKSGWMSKFKPGSDVTDFSSLNKMLKALSYAGDTDAFLQEYGEVVHRLNMQTLVY